MVVLAERRSSQSALWAGRLAKFSAVLFVVSGLGHRLGLVETIGFFWLLGVIGTLAIAALLLAAAGFYRLWTYGDRGGMSSAWAVVIALAAPAPFFSAARPVYTHPPPPALSAPLSDP